MPLKGYKQTNEHKSKRSFDNRKGCKLSDEHRRKIGLAMLNRVMSFDHRRKIAIASTGRIKSTEEREKLSKASKLRVFKQKRTKCEILVESILISRNVKYTSQYLANGITNVDFYLPDYHICLFVDGDYWHGNPDKFPLGSILRGGMRVEDRWAMDFRISNELISCGYRVVRLWERDIQNNNFSKLEKYIKEDLICLFQI